MHSGRMLGAALAGLVAIAAVVFAGWFFYCPCEQTPGGYLLGETVEAPVADWSFANEVPLCQIQVRARPLPHSVNLNCMATGDGDLYLSCARCAPKRWSSAVMHDSSARLRVGDRVYPVTATRVTDSEVMDRAWQARLEKLHELGRGRSSPATPRPPEDDWWTFRVVSRTD